MKQCVQTIHTAYVQLQTVPDRSICVQSLLEKLQVMQAQIESLKQENARLRGTVVQPAPQAPPASPTASTNNNVWNAQAPPAPAPAPAPPAQAPAPVAPPLVPAADNGPPTAVLLICYNRPQYLQRALDAITKYNKHVTTLLNPR